MTARLTCAADIAALQADLRLDPFAANNTHAYGLPNERLSREWHAREQTALCSSGSISVAAAIAAGVRFNSLGILCASRRQPPLSVVKLLLSGTRATQRAAGQLILDNDAAPRRRHQDTACSLALGLKPEVKQLMDHGYVTFNHTWGLRKAFGSVLKEGVRFALGKHSRAQRCLEACPSTKRFMIWVRRQSLASTRSRNALCRGCLHSPMPISTTPFTAATPCCGSPRTISRSKTTSQVCGTMTDAGGASNVLSS